MTFAGGTGTLVLDQPASFAGHISGFTGTAPDVVHSDAIDLVGINYDSSGFTETYNCSDGVLTVSDGTHGASLTFENFNGTFNFAADGHGGTLITDPPRDTSHGDVPAVANTDQFFFKIHSANANEEATNDYRAGQPKIGWDLPSPSPSEASGFNVWLSGHATIQGEDRLTSSTVDSQLSHENAINQGHVVRPDLHVNDFLLPHL